MTMKNSNQAAVATATQWLTDNCLILDTETTGLDRGSEIIEIAIINCNRQVLLNTLVQPLNSIPDATTAIHGITNEMVARAPSWDEVHKQVIALIFSHGFIAYNSEYDARLIIQSAKVYGLDSLAFRQLINSSHDCAMLLYAEFYGQWDERRENYKRQKLTAAAQQQGVAVDGQPHRALADCLLTLGVIKAIAAGGAE
ncbi:3'-5' exonuclease [Erwinia pyrifoliae]|uniref:3'-5' exonuclease n=1 Tax=Erwinia pyrifoliae TaxID=79967 RepID=A0ABY5XDR0_ERWPY|nr:3'-5' exonuclease [Erwinia pyrifoliae]MCT2387316.1 3'-5' exonuclease [Erwinia pyrifoliae]MCU8587084.1 3'-5' exonuclease [Erwinia pyrifoliae]UWS30947.1 3'-5' exonuclease [Erwinia pyrifoliae]UWS35255.1 3'-5' exonuclease [Erwinia pyrifoliae]